MLDLGMIDIAPRRGKPTAYHAFCIGDVERFEFVLVRQHKEPGKRRVYVITERGCSCPSPESPCKHRREFRELRTRAVLTHLDRLEQEPVILGWRWKWR